MKTCKECGVEKPMTEYYSHKQMADGYLNKCKDCVRNRVSKYTQENSEYYKQYDKKRAMLPHRVQARKEYLKTEKGKEVKRKSLESYKKRFPMKYAAHVIFRNAIRDKKIVKQTICSECSSEVKIEGHHDDYTKPLSVRWLCEKCHKEWHKHNKPIYE